jgi:hypothetical protein
MNPEDDIPKYENCSRIIREFLKDYSRSPTRIRYKWFCIPKRVYWNPIIRLSNCKIVQRTRKSKIKHTTPTTVLFFNLTEFPITISVTSIATNVNGCGIGVMGNTLTMDVDKTENKIQTVHVYPHAFENVNTRDYFSSDNSMTNSKTERENIYELLKYQNDIFWNDDKELEYHKCDNKKIMRGDDSIFNPLIRYRMKKIKNTIHRRQEKIFHDVMNIENVETIKAIENNTEKINNIEIMKKRAEIPRSNNEKPMQIGLDIRDKTAEEELSQDDKELKEMQIGLDIRDKTAEEELSQDDKELKEMQNRLDILYLENKHLRRSFQKRPDMEKFWDDKKLKIGAINRNLRLSSAMIDPCSHRYYLSIKIHDTDEDKGRLIMEDNIHRTNYDIIIRHEDIERPPKKTETAP